VGPCVNARGLISAAKEGAADSNSSPRNHLRSCPVLTLNSRLLLISRGAGALVNDAGITAASAFTGPRPEFGTVDGLEQLAVGYNPGWCTAGRVWPAAARLARGEGKTVGAAAGDPALDADRARFGSRLLPWLRAMTMSGEPQPTAQQLDGGYRPGAAGPFGR
jgi:hypothetical protein